MFPFIKPGDTLLIEVVDAEKLMTGDIAFYCLPSGTFVVHRLVKRNGSLALLTNGDSLRKLDDPVTAEQVFGKVSRIERGRKSLDLNGGMNNLAGRLIAILARYRLPLQINMKRTLGRLQWLLMRRRIV